jgi:hypothetical protein
MTPRIPALSDVIPPTPSRTPRSSTFQRLQGRTGAISRSCSGRRRSTARRSVSSPRGSLPSSSYPRPRTSRCGSTSRSTQYADANGVRFAYRRLGPDGGIPLVFMQHFRGGMDHRDPMVTDGLATRRPVILVDNAGVRRQRRVRPRGEPSGRGVIFGPPTSIRPALPRRWLRRRPRSRHGDRCGASATRSSRPSRRRRSS